MSYLFIGMPVFNGEKFISQALDSLLDQQFTDWTIFISDNASTDNTSKICQSYKERDSRILYVRQKRNLGPTANFTFLLSQAKSPFFMWAACDDLWEPDYIFTLIKLLETCPNAVMAFSNFDNIDGLGNSTRVYPKIKSLFNAGNRFFRANRFLWFPEIQGSANLVYGLMNTSAIKKIGGLKVYGKGDYGIDVLFVFRLALLGQFAYSDKTLFHKRQLPKSKISKKWNSLEKIEYQWLYQKLIRQSSISHWEKILLLVSSFCRFLVNMWDFASKSIYFKIVYWNKKT